LRKTKPGDWLADFWRHLQSQDLAPATRAGYHHDIVKFAQWFEETHAEKARLEAISSMDLAQYREHMTAVKRSKPATIKRKLEALRRLCRWAFQDKRTKTDLAQDLKPVRVARAMGPKGLADAEVHALFRVAGSSRGHVARRNYAIVQLLVQAGLRVGEVATLLIADARLSTRSGVVRIHGKGRKEREVPLNASARRALQSYLDQRGTVDPGEPLFTSVRGEAMAVRSVQHLINSLARRARIERSISPHTLRHTFSLNYLKSHPGKLVELATLLGHESLDTTAVYTRPSLDALAKDLEESSFNVYP
jgi:integrase/recombinase XerC